MAKNQHLGCIEEEKIHPQRRRERKKITSQPVKEERKKQPQTKLLNPPPLDIEWCVPKSCLLN